MKKKQQQKTVLMEQKGSNVIRQNYASNSNCLRRLVFNRCKTWEATSIDILNNTILGSYREVFNAWNQRELKVFTFLKAAYGHLLHLNKNYKQSPLTIHLIPIEPRHEGVYIQLKRLENYGR